MTTASDSSFKNMKTWKMFLQTMNQEHVSRLVKKLLADKRILKALTMTNAELTSLEQTTEMFSKLDQIEIHGDIKTDATFYKDLAVSYVRLNFEYL